jgi:hypothetical protein
MRNERVGARTLFLGHRASCDSHFEFPHGCAIVKQSKTVDDAILLPICWQSLALQLARIPIHTLSHQSTGQKAQLLHSFGTAHILQVSHLGT